MKGINTIRLLGEKRIKIFIIGMLILIIGLLFFFTLAVHLTMPKNFILLFFLCSIFGILLIFNIYLLFNTNEKLVIANLFIGMCFILLSILLFSTFSYIVSKGDISYIIVMHSFYILTGVATEIILVNKKFYNFKQLGKVSNSFWLYLLGAGIGKGAYEYLQKVYGKDISDIFGMAMFLVLALAFGFLGIFYINKIIVISRYKNIVHVIYED